MELRRFGIVVSKTKCGDYMDKQVISEQHDYFTRTRHTVITYY